MGVGLMVSQPAGILNNRLTFLQFYIGILYLYSHLKTFIQSITLTYAINNSLLVNIYFIIVLSLLLHNRGSLLFF